MKRGVFALVAVLVIASWAGALSTPDLHEYLFQAWTEQHSKVYTTSEERAARFNVFSKNLDLIREHNAAGHSWKMAMNHFGDQTFEEFAQAATGGYTKSLVAQQVNHDLASAQDLPSSVNWVQRGAVTSVKTQGQCSSCYAFAAVGAVEGVSEINTGVLVSLSEQELVDCSGPEGNMGCSGGTPEQGYEFIIKNGGLCSAASYPYQGSNGQCEASKCSNAAHISGWQNVPANNRDAMTAAVAGQPVAVAIQANSAGFQFYSSGVYTADCGSQLDHAVLAVGYGVDSGSDYWLIKNSWGADWGMNGYMELGRGEQYGSSGQCGILMEGSYPTA